MILFFNPGHEHAVQNASPYYMAPANVLRMQQELAYLPAWYGSPTDFVLIDEKTDKSRINALREIFPLLPKPIYSHEIGEYSNQELCLWGVSPQSLRFFEKIAEDHAINLKIPEWKEDYLYSNSRIAAQDCLKDLVQNFEEISSDIIPVFCENIEEIQDILLQKNGAMLAKAPYSSSGRGLIWLHSKILNEKQKQVLSGILTKQKQISLEPIWDKKTDFSLQFFSDGNGSVRFEGFSLFETGTRGEYLSGYLYSQEKILSILTEKIPEDLLFNTKEELLRILAEKFAFFYKGILGVDMMIYENNGKFCLHPCLEINFRYTMGYLAIKIQQNYLHKDSQGKMCIDYNKSDGINAEKHKELKKNHPLKLKNGLIEKAYLSLCPLSEETKYHAYIIVNLS